jgi:hypothetical protein
VQSLIHWQQPLQNVPTSLKHSVVHLQMRPRAGRQVWIGGT